MWASYLPQSSFEKTLYYTTLIVKPIYIDGTKTDKEWVHSQDENGNQLSKQHYTL